MKDYFFCYTKSLSDHLKARGFRYITVADNPRNNKRFSLWEITPELSDAIEEYKNNH